MLLEQLEGDNVFYIMNIVDLKKSILDGSISNNLLVFQYEDNTFLVNQYIDEIIASEKIYEVMKSNYGNYVIQKAIKLAKFKRS